MPAGSHPAAPPLRVTNPAVRKLLLAAYRAAGLHKRTQHSTPFDVALDKDYSEYYVSKTMLAERDRIRRALRSSGLAQLLPGGLVALPDITEAAPEILRPLLIRYSPRNYQQLVSYVARNLDWYLEPSRTTVAWHRLFSGPVLLGGGCLLWFALVFLIGALTQFESSGMLLVSVTYVLPVVLVAIGLLRFKDHARDELNALELYLYLREHFADDRGLPQ